MSEWLIRAGDTFMMASYRPLFFHILAFNVLLSTQSPSLEESRFHSQKNARCDMGSCYPATGNLLIGREKNLTASSTCGLHSVENYCIVSHLEDQKKCFTCDSTDATIDKPEYNHRIQHIIYSTDPGTNQQSWWQSENGKEHVTIQLDLEAEFHFTHLIMKFRTFRPSAMLIERSSDFGKTWKVYKYFAENCEEAFPYRTSSDPECDSRYSGVAPSNDGEVILRVITPGRTYNDPYSKELQALLKMTNLRINFTKLHTLGDDLLDKREEIQEKYYYAVKEMTVRGSCWCYGHAQRCLPVEGVQDQPDMVHGRCDCTHNTKGLNCQDCDDFHNDLPWSPAIGRYTNACRKCNCNNHAFKCKFSEELYEQSGRVSGGICKDCQHNTMGNNCEQCKQFYYLDPNKDISHPDACLHCECHEGGSLNGGLCDPKTDPANGLEAGRCHCKLNVYGRLCDRCKPGYWNFDPADPDGCEECTCNKWGTVHNSSCDVVTGECYCQPNVVGNDCNQCLPEHWGLGENSNGCKPCDCDIGGSLDTNCDVVTGECKCRPNIVGRTCSAPEQSYYVPDLDLVYEAEYANCSGNCKIYFRELQRNRPPTWTGPGYTRISDNTDLIFSIDNIRSSMEHDLVIRYEPQAGDISTDVRINVAREQPVDIKGPCANTQPLDDMKYVSLPSNSWFAVVNTPICLEAGHKYKIKLGFRSSDNNQVEAPSAAILVDSIALIPRIETLSYFNGSPLNELRKKEYERHRCNETYLTPLRPSHVSDECKKYHYSVSVTVHGGGFECNCNPTGSLSAFCDPDGGVCKCKPHVVGRTCDRCAPGTYGFGEAGCTACDCNSVGALNNFCDVNTGQCLCKNGTYGRSCNLCKPGSWNYPDCQLCECNGHAHTCDTDTGECIDCMDFTSGFHCERCQEGYYGDPKIGFDTPCRPCKCPDTEDSGHSFASTCILREDTQEVVCECEAGYAGPRCDVCADNYYGNPEEPGGRCRPCDCNNNIDITKPGNCDLHSGECLRCLFNTTGRNCELCEPHFYGDAVNQNCIECVCNMLGTDSKKGPCDRITGQCPCLPNVGGLSCDTCEPNHWKIASGQGCEPCNCDSVGSKSTQCNAFDGQCECKAGFGGRQCDQCQTNFWGDPKGQCHFCDCNPEGSRTLQCHQNNGTCVCNTGIGGEKCDKCARGYIGQSPYCKECGECFNNWDNVISELSEKTNNIIRNAREINRTGASGAYNSEFESMNSKIENVKKTLADTRNNTAELSTLTKEVEEFKEKAKEESEKVSDINLDVLHVLNRVSVAKLSLSANDKRAKELNDHAEILNYNATRLQEKDRKGALSLTRESGEMFKQVQGIEKETKKLLGEADRQCKRTLTLIKDNVAFANTEQNNENLRQELEFKLSQLKKKIPSINKDVCDGGGTNLCDELCGGGGCETCGGISCEDGAVNLAENGLKYAVLTENNIEMKHNETDKKFRDITSAQQEVQNAHQIVQEAYNYSLHVKTQFENIVQRSSKMTNKLKDFIDASGATPAEIRNFANDALKSSIPLKPEQIMDLALRIKEKISSLKDVKMILEITKDDQLNATKQKKKAYAAKLEADNVHAKATNVVDALDAAKAAQEIAEEAVTKANEDITAAKKYLTQIGSDTVEADMKANETSKKMKELKDRLTPLQKTVYRNTHEAYQVSVEIDRVAKEVQMANSNVIVLKEKYNDMNEVLKKRSLNSSNLKERAKQLLERAQQLLHDTQAKHDELQEAENVYTQQKKSLSQMQAAIDTLLENVRSSTDEIESKAYYYQDCNN